LNFLAGRRDIILIFKTESVEHFRENAEALDFTLDPEDVVRVDQTFPP